MTRENPWAASMFAIGLIVTGCGGAAGSLSGAAKAGATAASGAEARVATVRLAVYEEPPPVALERVTPLRVRLENHGRAPVEVRYRHFAITSEDGSHSHAALPPFHVHGEVPAPTFVTTLDHAGFSVAATYAEHYGGIPPWEGAFRFDDVHYDAQVSEWRELGLPSAQMLARALPEGVVQPGGHVDGVVYFRSPPPRMRDVVLRAEVVALGGERLGSAVIPLAR